MDEVRANLPSVRAPTLVIHGRHDHTVPMEDSLELTGCLGAEVIERLWLEKSFHVVTLDVERATVAERAVRFVGRQAGWAEAAGTGAATPPPDATSASNR
jgi:carboxylesterase